VFFIIFYLFIVKCDAIPIPHTEELSFFTVPPVWWKIKALFDPNCSLLLFLVEVTVGETDHSVDALMPEVLVLPEDVSEETGGAAEVDEAIEVVDGLQIF